MSPYEIRQAKPAKKFTVAARNEKTAEAEFENAFCASTVKKSVSSVSAKATKDKREVPRSKKVAQVSPSLPDKQNLAKVQKDFLTDDEESSRHSNKVYDEEEDEEDEEFAESARNLIPPVQKAVFLVLTTFDRTMITITIISQSIVML